MLQVLDPFRFVLIAVAGWMNQREYQIIDYLREENRVLREQLGERRLQFDDDQCRRLALKAKVLAGRLLDEMSPIVTWETLLAWHRKLIALKYDGRGKRGPRRPRTAAEIEALVVRIAIVYFRKTAHESRSCMGFLSGVGLQSLANRFTLFLKLLANEVWVFAHSCISVTRS